MFLKSISLSELNFSESWEKGWVKINALNNFDKCMTVFWFLGPFIYLIERDPADLWLTSIAIIFLIKCIRKNEWTWSKQLWFKCALLFWIISLTSAILSSEQLFAMQQGFVWIRFPLYAAAAQVWLAKDRDIRIVMLLSILIGALIMCSILTAELILEPKLRLMWPYNDLVPGTYLAKTCLPLVCIFVALSTSIFKKITVIYLLLVSIIISITILTGERTNTLIILCSSLLSFLFWKKRFFSSVIFLCLILSALLITIKVKPRLHQHFIEFQKRVINLDNPSNEYWGAWRGGIQQFSNTPIFGNGPSMTRKTCTNLEDPLKNPDQIAKKPQKLYWLPGVNYCGNHPHNFYIQMLAETGIFGFIFGVGMFITIILSCYKERKLYPLCPMISLSFIVPFAIFFPFQQFGSFFGQWGNLFLWFSVGFSISQVQSWRLKN
jgi:O-antigen ligase